MTVAMSVRIIFPKNERRQGFVLRTVHQVDIDSSWRQLTDVAEILLPRNVRYFESENVGEVFQRGDKVIIQLGYDDNLITEFVGYISRVSADIPILISCQDEMFKVKQIPVNYSHPDVSLKKLLSDLIPGYEIDALEGCQLGAVRFSKTTVDEVLEKLQQDMKLYTYVEPTTKKIVSGKIYADNSDDSSFLFDLERNVVSNDLSYRNKDDIRVKVNGILIKSGDKIEYSYGDDDADKNIDWQFLVKTKAELEVEVKRMYEANKLGGYDGSFTAFGAPSVQHGRKASLRSSLYKDREGTYYIEGVYKSFGISGYRQQIKLGNLYERGN